MKKTKTKFNIKRRNFLTGTVSLAGAAATASIIPINIAKANKQSTALNTKAVFTETCPQAIGRFLVLSTIKSIFLSKISFTIQPADLINIAPRKNKKENL